MDYFWIIVVMVVSYFFSAIGFPQIIGSLQTHQQNWSVTILLWLIILAGIYLLILSMLPRYKIACFIGASAALLATLSAGKIQ